MDHAWTSFIKHLLDVGLTQNRKTMTLRMLTTVDLFYIIMYKDPLNKNSLK
jgi:hypothetical protein